MKKKLLAAVIAAAVITGSSAAAVHAAVRRTYTATQECFDSISDLRMKIIGYNTSHAGIRHYVDGLYTAPAETGYGETYAVIAPDDILTEDDLHTWAAGEDICEYSGQKLMTEYEDDVVMVLYDPNAEEPDRSHKAVAFRARYGGRIIVPKNFRQNADGDKRVCTYVGEHTEEAVNRNFDFMLGEFSGYVIPNTNLIMLARNVYTDAETGDICYDVLGEDLKLTMWHMNETLKTYRLTLNSIRISDGSDSINAEEKASREFTDPKEMTCK